ncbi:MAG: hypothetical protein MUE85_04005 [Microscillaceae bacterium]|jgi:uncharacterized MAPEG superfamily protein|nr:hypothetical protein [Microscillaceae bacterium]
METKTEVKNPQKTNRFILFVAFFSLLLAIYFFFSPSPTGKVSAFLYLVIFGLWILNYYLKKHN